MAEEATVPIFTILKNGVILKNIFIVNNPSVVVHAESADLVSEEVLNVGRHPDCHIELTHPSISRFHLQIFSNPSLQKLSVMDLSSAHGTWVSDKRIEPGVRVEINEGDTLRVGSSSRVYRLQWVPLNQAYDLEHPFVSAMDVTFLEEGEEEEEDSTSNEEEMRVGAHQDDLVVIEHGESRAQEVLQERVEEILPLEKEKFETLNVEVEARQESGVAEEIPVNAENEETESINDVEIIAVYKDDLVNIDNGKFGENEDPLEQIDKDIPANPMEASEVGCFPQYACQDESKENIYYQEEAKEGIYQAITISNEEFHSLDGRESNSFQSDNQDSGGCLEYEKFEAFDSLEYDSEAANSSGHCSLFFQPESACLSSYNVLEEAGGPKFDSENSTLLVDMTLESELFSEMESVNNRRLEEHEERNGSNTYLENSAKKLVNPCLALQNVLSDVTGRHFDKENQTTECNRSSIWSRRGKPAAVLELQTGRKSRKSRSTGFNAENKHKTKENTENSFVVRDLFAELDREDEEDEVFTPNKENMTPNTRKLKFMKDIGKFEGLVLKEKTASHSSDKENQPQLSNSKPLKGSNLKNFSSPVVFNEDDLVLDSSDKENQTPESAKVRKRAQPASRSRSRLVQGILEVQGIRERLPFQSLDVKSSVPKVAAETKRSCWIMVADTSCFLDKESWKSLQLLEGLRGTQLVVPRIVIRELDSMRRQFSLFRRTTKVSLVLEWIEEAMVNSKWWIHVQSSAEEGRSIAPTPTAATAWSPRFSSFDEVISPTAEDHVLDYALFFNRMKMNTSAKVVLLSNDISLKIKAMAEGLLCETAQEFRDSLVSPLSDRFMWAQSCPRGRTWSCSEEDVLLKEKNQYMKKRDAKGLKLILLHNVNYSRQINSS